MEQIRLCFIEGCQNKYMARGVCRKHYGRFRYQNKLKNYKKERCTFNDYYEKDGDIILIANGNNSSNNEIIIDKKSLPVVNMYRWYVSAQGYARTKHNNKLIYIHHLFIDKGNYDIDHINRNKLDNRIENLRIVSRGMNVINTNVRKNNTSGVTGVYFIKREGIWGATIRHNEKVYHLGRFSLKEDAILARKHAELALFGITVL